MLALAVGGAWDLERSIFLSRCTSPPVARLFKELPRFPGRAPDPENHSPDLVRISCCLRHRLQTHITCRESEGQTEAPNEGETNEIPDKKQTKPGKTCMWHEHLQDCRHLWSKISFSRTQLVPEENASLSTIPPQLLQVVFFIIIYVM